MSYYDIALDKMQIVRENPKSEFWLKNILGNERKT